MMLGTVLATLYVAAVSGGAERGGEHRGARRSRAARDTTVPAAITAAASAAAPPSVARPVRAGHAARRRAGSVARRGSPAPSAAAGAGRVGRAARRPARAGGAPRTPAARNSTPAAPTVMTSATVPYWVTCTRSGTGWPYGAPAGVCSARVDRRPGRWRPRSRGTCDLDLAAAAPIRTGSGCSTRSRGSAGEAHADHDLLVELVGDRDRDGARACCRSVKLPGRTRTWPRCSAR